MKRYIAISIAFVLLCACDKHVQTTSGESYLEKYKDVPVVSVKSGDAVSIEEKIREVAKVEPVLTFPARIGIARVDHGRLTTIPGEELEAWVKLSEKLGKSFGEFIPVNPMIAMMVAGSVSAELHKDVEDAMNVIRLGAARQHLDAVLIYETYGNTEISRNLLGIGNATIIGAYLLPSRSVGVKGFASAILIDVIQGYPYGTANATVDREEVLSTWDGEEDAEREMDKKAKGKAVIKLVEETEKMVQQLRLELAEKRAAKKQ